MGEATHVDRVETMVVTMAPGQATGRHVHPCPVVGYVARGVILFQIEGSPPQELTPGDAFFEPANVAVTHFDNIATEPARFVANYLLKAGETERIRMLPEPAG